MRYLQRCALRVALRQGRHDAVVALFADRLRDEDVAVALVRPCRRAPSPTSVGQRAHGSDVLVERQGQVVCLVALIRQREAHRRQQLTLQGGKPAVNTNVLERLVEISHVGNHRHPRGRRDATAREPWCTSLRGRHVHVDHIASVAPQEGVVGLRHHDVVVDTAARPEHRTPVPCQIPHQACTRSPVVVVTGKLSRLRQVGIEVGRGAAKPLIAQADIQLHPIREAEVILHEVALVEGGGLIELGADGLREPRIREGQSRGRIDLPALGEEKLIERRHRAADTSHRRQAAEDERPVDVRRPLAEADRQQVDARLDGVAALRPGQIVDNVHAAFVGDTVAVGVAVEAGDAAHADVRRVRTRGDAVRDAACRIQHTGLVHERGPQHRDELGGERVGIFVEPRERFVGHLTAAEGRFAVEIVVEAE